MKKEEKSKVKFNIILSTIGSIICLTCLLLEVLFFKDSIIFWLILLLCNIVILIGNLHEYKK